MPLGRGRRTPVAGAASTLNFDRPYLVKFRRPIWSQRSGDELLGRCSGEVMMYQRQQHRSWPWPAPGRLSPSASAAFIQGDTDFVRRRLYRRCHSGSKADFSCGNVVALSCLRQWPCDGTHPICHRQAISAVGCEAARIRGGRRNFAAHLRLGQRLVLPTRSIWVAHTAGRNSSRPVPEPWLPLETEAAARVAGVCPHVRRFHRISAGWRGDSVAGVCALALPHAQAAHESMLPPPMSGIRQFIEWPLLVDRPKPTSGGAAPPLSSPPT